MSGAETFTLYGMQISWYSAKLRPYLRFKGIPHVERLPSLYTCYHKIKKVCGNPALPVLVTPEGEWLQDTSIIIERLVALSVGHPEAYPRGGLTQQLKGYYVPILASPIGESFLEFGDWRMFRLVTHYPAEFDHWKTELSCPGRLYAAIGSDRDTLRLVLPRKYPRVAVPVVGVWSTGDHALARKQLVISGEYVDADWRYEGIAGAGHWLQLDARRR
jgi:hypothetical protein